MKCEYIETCRYFARDDLCLGLAENCAIRIKKMTNQTLEHERRQEELRWIELGDVGVLRCFDGERGGENDKRRK